MAKAPFCAIVLSLSALACTAAHAELKISDEATMNVSCSGGVCTATAKKAVLSVGDLANMLAAGDVTVASGNLAKDIEIDAALTWTSTHRLTLDAYDSITFNKPVEVIGRGTLTIKTGDGQKGGDFRFLEKGHVKFWDTASNLVINGNTYALAKSLSQIKRLIHRGHGGAPYIALARKIDAAKYSGGVLPVSPDILEGLGNTISNLTISSGVDRSNVGLFLEIGEVRDIGFVNVNIVGVGDDQAVGAIAGIVGGGILHCFVTGKISATGALSGAGALAGLNDGSIADAYSDASVSVAAGGSVVGGLVAGNEAGNQGQWKGSIRESYSAGTVTGGDAVKTGGLVGYNYGAAISNSYATGPVDGSNSSVGGLTGANADSDSSSPKITSSFSTSSVTGSNGALIGGLIGSDTAQTGTANAYWDLDTSGISNPHQGAGNVPDDPGITGLTDAQLKSALPQGFDKSIWAQNPKINNGYPYLIANPPPK